MASWAVGSSKEDWTGIGLLVDMCGPPPGTASVTHGPFKGVKADISGQCGSEARSQRPYNLLLLQSDLFLLCCWGLRKFRLHILESVP